MLQGLEAQLHSESIYAKKKKKFKPEFNQGFGSYC